MITQTAKEYLKGHWGRAVWAEGLIIAAGWVLKLIEWGGLLLAGLSLSSEPGLPISPAEQREWMIRGILWLCVVILDWLWISPLLLGRKALYIRMVKQETNALAGVLRQYFKKGKYKQALQWRICSWGLRLWWSLLIWTPAILLWRMGEGMRLQALHNATSVLPAIGIELSGSILYLLGWGLIELVMLRYLPAVYGMKQGLPTRKAFRYARLIMKGHIPALLRLYRRYFLGICSCFLVLPSLYVMPLLRVEQTKRILLWAKMTVPIEKTTIIW